MVVVGRFSFLFLWEGFIVADTIMANEARKKELVKQYGRIWDTTEMQEDYNVKGFSMGIVVVKRKSDNQLGSLDFDHAPRWYYNFVAH